MDTGPLSRVTQGRRAETTGPHKCEPRFVPKFHNTLNIHDTYA